MQYDIVQYGGYSSDYIRFCTFLQIFYIFFAKSFGE